MSILYVCEMHKFYSDTLYTNIMPMTHAPETGTENLYQYRKLVPVFCRCVMRIGIDFSGTEIWYGVEQCSTRCRKPWPKWRVLIGQTIASCVVCLYKLCCLLFYCFKMNWRNSSIEKFNPEILLPVSSGTKKLCPKNGTRKVFGTGFWCVSLA